MCGPLNQLAECLHSPTDHNVERFNSIQDCISSCAPYFTPDPEMFHSDTERQTHALALALFATFAMGLGLYIARNPRRYSLNDSIVLTISLVLMGKCIGLMNAPSDYDTAKNQRLVSLINACKQEPFTCN